MLSSRLVFALFWVSTATAGSAQPASAGEPDAVRQRELVRLVRQDCGSCHGMTLQGGLGPALLPATLLEKPVEGLVATIYYGRPGTPMPPWNTMLSAAEAEWLLNQLLQGSHYEK